MGALGNSKFPAGAEEQVRTNLVLSSDITIDNVWTRGLPQDRNTLETVVARYPASAVAPPGPGGSLSMGITTGSVAQPARGFRRGDQCYGWGSTVL